MEELYMLQQSEFQVLAAAAGLEKVYGIHPEGELDEGALMYTVHEMAGKGILNRQQEGPFSMEEPYRTAFSSMKNAKCVLAVAGYAEEASELCLYFGEKLITVEESLRDEDAVKIGIFEKEDLFDLLQERGFFPKPFLEADLAALQTKEDMLQEKANREYARYVLYSGAETPFAEWVLIENPCNYWIEEKRDAGTEYCHYDGQNLYERIRSFL